MSIHSTAIVGPGVQLGTDVEIGAYSVIEGDVTLGDRVRVGPPTSASPGTPASAKTAKSLPAPCSGKGPRTTSITTNYPSYG